MSQATPSQSLSYMGESSPPQGVMCLNTEEIHPLHIHLHPSLISRLLQESSHIMKAIEKQTLDPELRSEIVRDLVTHMYSFTEKPSPRFQEDVAQKLVSKW